MFQNAPHWQRKIWGTAEVTEEVMETIQTELMKDNINAGGDGSVNRGFGAQALCIFKKDTFEILLKGASVVRGHSETTASMRPETVSSIAAGSFLNLISKHQ